LQFLIKIAQLARFTTAFKLKAQTKAGFFATNKFFQKSVSLFSFNTLLLPISFASSKHLFAVFENKNEKHKTQNNSTNAKKPMDYFFVFFSHYKFNNGCSYTSFSAVHITNNKEKKLNTKVKKDENN
jgi:hypothetical protein